MLRLLLTSLTPKDWAIVLGGLGIVVGIELFRPAPVTLPQMFAESATLHRDDSAALTPEESQALDDALTGRAYFGAFALGEQSGYGWAVGFATAAAAEAAALAYCAQNDSGCAVVARILPEGVTRPPRDSLSYAQRQALAEVSRQLGPRAFARSLDGSFGIARGLTLQEAQEVAFVRCNVGRDIPPFLPPMPCQVIAAWTEDLLPPRAD